MRVRGLTIGMLRQLLRAAAMQGLKEGARVFICLADHYEPMWKGAALSVQNERVDRWVREYPRCFAHFRDSLDRPPQHSFFWPAEAYNGEQIEKLAGLCRQGFGDVEVHLHHDNDSADNLRATLESFTRALFHVHGLLRTNSQDRIAYGFIHGNWALDNSRPDGRWCGVNDELTVLRETGCYADFTMPSAPDPTQTRMVNSIYYATDDPKLPKSHDEGVSARVHNTPPPDGLLIIQGPLMLDWRHRKWRVLPRLENSELHGSRPPSPARFELWVRAGVGVIGQPNWIFIKLHTHGAKEVNATMLLGDGMQQFHRDLAELARACTWLKFYYVTAFEMAQLVHQAERGALEPKLDT